MCYNCGCEIPNDNMGHVENITESTFEKAAEAEGQSLEEAKKNTLQLLAKSLGYEVKKPE